ncbi:MAG: uroporphyrinogen decarboxylase [Bdellovibrionaceae bacterium]|nr:uroporphyrinogen decarboxylase [Bdellovibrionales bacterium]MCB9085659.1 uroporphyrinogen decarboxylase [Pseudobdellovibrionaceae bacterium]
MANERFSNALSGIAQKVPPIWMMRQAGRYHKHYQALKEKYSFMELCKEPELAAEVAMGPIDDFDFDVAILFSDLLFPLEALGMGLEYSPGPQLGWTLTPETINQLLPVDEAIGDMEFQRLAVQATRGLLPQRKSLIGFVGGPWTLFAYAVEGSHKGGLKEAKAMWSLFPAFTNIIEPFLQKNIALQLEAGAEVVMVFDTAAGELSPQMYRDLVAPTVKKIAKSFPGKIGYYSQNTQLAHLFPFFNEPSELAGMGFDHRWELPTLFELVPGGFVQGNFDQTLMFTDEADFARKLEFYLQPFQELSPEERKGWVCGLGHGVLPATPEANVRTFVDTVRETFA